MSTVSDLAWLASGLTADAAKITLDQPGNGYDRLYALTERYAPLPRTRRGRIILAGAALLAKHLLPDVEGRRGPLSRFAAEVSDDGLLETLKRLIEHADASPAPSSAPAPTTHRIDALTAAIAPWMRRKGA